MKKMIKMFGILNLFIDIALGLASGGLWWIYKLVRYLYDKDNGI